MKKLNNKLIAGIVTTIIIYGIFFSFQVSFAQRFNNKLDVNTDSINKQALLKLNNEVIQTLNLRVDTMEKYVDAGQKNLDLWLKLLTFILSVLIGFSVYSGLKTRELAKEELVETRKIKESITKEANDAEDRLKNVNDKILLMERSLEITKSIEEKATNMLEGLASKENLVMNEAQKTTIDHAIKKAKEELQKSGLESLKNLYFAKAIKAYGSKEWEEVIRLLSIYIDLNETNKNAFFKRAWAYDELAFKFSGEERIQLLKKSIDDLSEVIRLDPNYASAFNNRADEYEKASEYEKALEDFTTAIRLSPNDPHYYENRASLYKTMKKDIEAEQDYTKARELEKSLTKSA
jgi:tetratricopeptide (TPR) repeat protein